MTPDIDSHRVGGCTQLIMFLGGYSIRCIYIHIYIYSVWIMSLRSLGNEELGMDYARDGTGTTTGMYSRSRSPSDTLLGCLRILPSTRDMGGSAGRGWYPTGCGIRPFPQGMYSSIR